MLIFWAFPSGMTQLRCGSCAVLLVAGEIQQSYTSFTCIFVDDSRIALLRGCVLSMALDGSV
jgi:hypothetical protein